MQPKIYFDEEKVIAETAEVLSTSKDEILSKVRKQLDYKKLEQEINALKSRMISSDIDEYIKNVIDINGVKFLSLYIDGADIKALRDMSDKLKEKLASAIILLASKNEDKAAFIVSVTPDYVEKGFNAGKIAKAFAADIKGSGGGKPDSAQGGSKDFSNLSEAVKKAQKYIS